VCTSLKWSLVTLTALTIVVGFVWRWLERGVTE